MGGTGRGRGDDDDDAARSMGRGEKGGVGGGGGGEEGMRGLARRLWMGGEREGWQRRRLEREREELEGGKGYGDIIMGQVREVFPGFGGKRKEEEEEEGEGKEEGGDGDEG
ncbi:hypothetical protein N7G274_009748 [Stereocaulon virgatum]|uniref:Uncharacterized protein n=1 Tax=Stereocaulon virgatum TaxID=373712 RepID=A0ABR3ZV35_9LECA